MAGALNQRKEKLIRTLRGLAIALAASFPVAAAARAGTLSTHPIVVESAHSLTCLVANEGKKPVRNVVVEVVRYNVPPPATVADTDNIAELIPLQYIAARVVADTDNAYLCRFTFSGSGKGLRASGVLRDDQGAVVDTQPAR